MYSLVCFKDAVRCLNRWELFSASVGHDGHGCLSHTWVMIMGKRAGLLGLVYVRCVIRCCCRWGGSYLFLCISQNGLSMFEECIFEIFSAAAFEKQEVTCWWQSYVFIPLRTWCTNKIVFNMLLWASVYYGSYFHSWLSSLPDSNIVHSFELNSLMSRSSDCRLDGYCVDPQVLHLLT